MDETRLEAMLTVREVVTRGETFKIKLAVHEAELTRDAIVKSLYEVRTRSRSVALDSIPFGSIPKQDRLSLSHSR